MAVSQNSWCKNKKVKITISHYYVQSDHLNFQCEPN